MQGDARRYGEMQGDVGSLLLERVRDLAALLLLVDQLAAHAQHLRAIGG